MTVLLVFFLFLFFVGTDHVVRLASKRAAAKPPKPTRIVAQPYADMARRMVG